MLGQTEIPIAPQAVVAADSGEKVIIRNAEAEALLPDELAARYWAGFCSNLSSSLQYFFSPSYSIPHLRSSTASPKPPTTS
jgi:hypothetical protein